MTIDLYYVVPSPPCRSVNMVAKYLGIDVNIKLTDVVKGDHRNEEFRKMNPLTTVPTINDDGFYLSESRAIMAYLVNQYAPGNSLYPNEPKKRAIVDRMLYFDVEVLFQPIKEYFLPQLINNDPPNPVKEDAMKKSLNHLDNFLSKQKFVAGEEMTIADISIIASLTYCESMNYDLSSYSNIIAWQKRVQDKMPFYGEVNDQAKEIIQAFLKKRNSS